ncbi:peptidyl-prolyl cis-trans isomerase, FKBP-type, putative [marine gamma proteobacterium HTCC2148]|jgi:FKBP-type peptidyl-prolyl cis-trans isomerase SlpA|nr:peptidyl-prolyl cis-trans isomerase, FKBP-type, putative [marine gamma proteobacterium HTCC2148]MBT3411088.1 peptidylprolyl isomerase [Halieaceae bacterium]MBT5007877.1 peptidylprolyl isomerase [Halieaceae bacterium]MBT6123772.1 peptidylprolyl isomerase [Halieaceae bacterium]MBT7719668.1 peptidylprolyl isomerase [Halieaceae bacterium]
MTDFNVPVSEGTRVFLNFSVSLEDGSEVDTNFGGDPVDFAIGDGSLLPGFERRIFGMLAGDRQMFEVPPEDAFGQPNENNVQRVPLEQFDEDIELEIGLVFSFADAAGGELPGMIISFDDKEVTIDFNHPLAGRTILFDVLIHRVEPAELH